MTFIYEETTTAAEALARYREIVDQRQTGPYLLALAEDLADATAEDSGEGFPEQLAALAARLNALACEPEIPARMITLMIGLTAVNLAARKG